MKKISKEALQDNYSIIIELDAKAFELFEHETPIFDLENHDVYHFNKDICIVNARFAGAGTFKVYEDSIRAYQSSWYDNKARDIVKAMKNNKMLYSNGLEALKNNLNDLVMASLKHHEKEFA